MRKCHIFLFFYFFLLITAAAVATPRRAALGDGPFMEDAAAIVSPRRL